MFKNLSPGAVGIRATLPEALELAKAAGFDGIDVGIGEAAKLVAETSADHVRGLFAKHGLKPGGWGLPVEFRKDGATFQAGLAQLPAQARIGAELGCFRVPTWVLPYSDEQPYARQFELLAGRFRAIAEILKDHGCSLGLEFVGPKTSRAGHKHEFIHTMGGMLEMCDAVGTGNVGLLLDCWHWYVSHGTLEDLRKLKPGQVVYVHVNDAPAGVPIDEQVDNVRRMPGETGVIDIAGFLKALAAIGYDGPVTPEPFNPKLRELPAAEAARVTFASLRDIWEKAGMK
jgi:sugar phosphate isomerase/epimerase